MIIRGKRIETKAFISKFPKAAAARLTDLCAGRFDGTIASADVEEMLSDGLISEHELMNLLLPLVKEYAIAPVSEFRIGAIARGLSGTFYCGANIEFPGEAPLLTIHAEQAAVINAALNGELGIKALAVSSAPCGCCRQFLSELPDPEEIEIILDFGKKVKLSSLLPESFQWGDGAPAFMQHGSVSMFLENPEPDMLTLEAFSQAQLSYAPYTDAYAGAAIEMQNGSVYRGFNVENSAFNPGITPMQAALIDLVMSGADFADIMRAVLVQSRSSETNLFNVSFAVLDSLCGIEPELEYAD